MPSRWLSINGIVHYICIMVVGAAVVPSLALDGWQRERHGSLYLLTVLQSEASRIAL